MIPEPYKRDYEYDPEKYYPQVCFAFAGDQQAAAFVRRTVFAESRIKELEKALVEIRDMKTNDRENTGWDLVDAITALAREKIGDK